MPKQKLTILGSTGSVGCSTLDVAQEHPDQYQVVALTAYSNAEKMFEQCRSFEPEFAVLVDSDAASALAQRISKAGLNTQVLSGAEQVTSLARAESSEAVMSAIVGAAGLLPTLAAVQAGKRVLIANKEPLVMTGQLLMDEARRSGAVILPIDSEHNAIFQCLPENQSTNTVNRIHLTASGGPFRGRDWSALDSVTPEQACAHPNWEMGKKISVDSATMMNKGLELIEATVLFGVPEEHVEILVHPQSIIHSMVEYCDGSFLAQLGAPDMRIPIAHAMAWPNRHGSGAATLDLRAIARLDFAAPDMANLPCLRLARTAAQRGGSAPAVLNAANEVAVEAFLKQKIKFTAIPSVIEAALETVAQIEINDISHVLTIDNEARRCAHEKLDSM